MRHATGLCVLTGALLCVAGLGAAWKLAAAASFQPESAGKAIQVELGKPFDAELDLEQSAHADFFVDVPADALVLRWKLRSKRSELTFSARRGHGVTNDQNDSEGATEGGKAEIVFDRFSEPAIGKDRFHARVAWTFQSRPRTAQDRLTRIPFTIEASVVLARVEGDLPAGQLVRGVLTPASGGSSTYRFDLPAGTTVARLDIVDSASDLDLYARAGAPFLVLDDAVRFAQHPFGRETLILGGSTAAVLESGPWYVDVVDAFDEDRPARFTLLLTLGAEAPPYALAIPRLEPAIGSGPLARSLAAVVELANDDGGGSGTILSKDGWILTNAHVVEGLGGGSTSEVVVAVTLDPHEPATELFRAKVERVDAARDMALVHVVSGFYGQMLPDGYVFPTVECAPPDGQSIGDPLWLVGYPTTGGRGSRVTISATRGIVSGFDQASFGPVIKTDAEITSGNSGGAALDADGRLVGIATSTVENGSGQIGYVHPLAAMPESWRELWKR